jgi:hypothetical protein
LTIDPGLQILGEDGKKVLELMLEIDPSKRPDPQDLLKQPFMNDIDNEDY